MSSFWKLSWDICCWPCLGKKGHRDKIFFCPGTSRGNTSTYHSPTYLEKNTNKVPDTNNNWVTTMNMMDWKIRTKSRLKFRFYVTCMFFSRFFLLSHLLLIWWKVLSTMTKNHALKGGKLHCIFTQDAIRTHQNYSANKYIISNLSFPPFSSATNLMENLVDNDKIFFTNKENCTQKRNFY